MPERADWKLYRDRQGGVPGDACLCIKWTTNENHQKPGNRQLKACARRLPGKKRNTRAGRGTIWPGALIASKNALKAPMEKAHKKNRKGDYTADPARRFRARTFHAEPVGRNKR